MNGDLTVGDVMTREFVGVNEGDSVSGVAALLLEAGEEGAVVLRGAEPVGMVGAHDLLGVVADGDDADAVSVGSIMSDVVESIGPDVPLVEAVTTLAALDARRLVVVDDGEVLGVLSEHDVVTAQMAVPEAEELEAQLSVAAGAGSQDDRYSTQSVCEACGVLAESLVNVNGQLLCADCREL